MIAYPNAEDYVRAVQQPHDVFRSEPLRRAAFELHPVFGIPMPAAGSAAVVFKASVEGVDTALRFFIQDDVSTRDRYNALGQHFGGRGLADCVARANWVNDAIAINGATWPLVQMEWIEGRSLDEYVAHLARTSDVGALACLAGIWRGFIARLQDAEFAHGDLQHGNVIVDRTGSLRLVDFDGSWIAAFRGGAPPRETGHPNYQRTGRTWGRWMDTFPGLVIYTALLGLSRRPDSWEMLHNGENMLFSHSDFAPPFRTPTWELLSSIRDDEVVHAVTRLKQACEPRWQANSLELFLRPQPVGPPSVPSPTRVYPGVGRMNDRWWEPRVAGSGVPHSQGVPRPFPATPRPGTRVPSAQTPLGARIPPPPPKNARSTHGGGPGFGRVSRTGWYPPPPPPPYVPPTPPAPNTGPGHATPDRAGRSTGSAVMLAVLVALVSGGIALAASGGRSGAGLIVGLIAFAVSLAALTQRGGT